MLACTKLHAYQAKCAHVAHVAYNYFIGNPSKSFTVSIEQNDCQPRENEMGGGLVCSGAGKPKSNVKQMPVLERYTNVLARIWGFSLLLIELKKLSAI